MEYLDKISENCNDCTDCTVCSSSTEYMSNCCTLSICENCYIEWLKNSRECMHCRKDQMSFDEWVENYREDNSSPPLALIPMGFSITADLLNDDGEEEEVSVNFTPEEILELFMTNIESNVNIDRTINSDNLHTMLRLMNDTLHDIEERVLNMDEHLEIYGNSNN